MDRTGLEKGRSRGLYIHICHFRLAYLGRPEALGREMGTGKLLAPPLARRRMLMVL